MTLPVLYTLTDDTIMFGEFAPIAVVIISVVLQMLQNNILMPYVMGRETKMHPLLVLSSILFFGYLFGVIGIILAIPLTGTIKSTLEYYKDIKSKTKSNKVL
jgi:putative permease